MQFRSDSIDGVRVIQVEGRWTGGPENVDLHKDLKRWLDDGERVFLLDLGETELLTSLGLGAMVSCYSTCTREGAALHLCGLSPRNHQVVAVARLLSLFQEYPDRAAALAGMKKAHEG